jgi:hypothetical protein
MHPYQHKRLTEGPDIADIQNEGRRSGVGRLSKKSGDCRPYCRNKKSIRRTLKRADKAIQLPE